MADRQRAGPGRAGHASRRVGAPLDRPPAGPIVVSGYYGSGNLGDEAVLAGLLGELRTVEPGARLVVLSGDPAATSALHLVEARPRSPRAVWNALAGARLFISGGGSLVQDITSARSAVYYLGTLFTASWRGVPVAVIGQGIGPLRRPWMRRLARRAFDRARIISVRDADSAQTLSDLGVARPVHHGADLALLMPPATPDRVHALLARAGLDAAGARIGVAVRPWPGLIDPRALGEAIRRAAAAHAAAIAVLVFDRTRDLSISQALAQSCHGCLVDAPSPQELLGVVGAMDVLLGVRLHALIFAAAQGIPAIGVSYDPKVSSFAAESGLPGLLPIDVSAEVVEQTLARVWEQRAGLRERLQASVPALRRAAASGVRAIAEVLAAPPTS